MDFGMYLDYRRLREEQLMRDSGPACPCGRRTWSREPVRDPEYRSFRCRACLTLLTLPAGLFQQGPAERPEAPGRRAKPT
jgi:hypothetical protein